MLRARNLHMPALVLLILAAATPLRAQVLRGVVTERGAGQPLAGAMVVLLDSAEHSVGLAFTDAAGRFEVRAPGPGRYRSRVDRIGYASVLQPAVDLGAGAEAFQRIEVSVTPVALEEIEVEAGQRCVVRPGDGTLETARVWEQARAALSSTVETERLKLLRFDAETWRRRLDARSLRVTEEKRAPRRNGFSVPFKSRPATELIEKGFVREVEGGLYYEFFAPSAEVLLSDAFLDTHCFRLLAGTMQDSLLLGLSFEPVGRRRVSDIEGTLWLESASAGLRRVDLRYVGRDPRLPLEGAHAQVEFQALPGGRWIVTRWHIRMPELAAERVTFDGRGDVRRRVVAFWEEGGEVTRISEADGSTVSTADRYALKGVAFDSTTRWPLGFARVILEGTSFVATADVEGRFTFEAVPAGIYTATIEHPRLDSLPPLAQPWIDVDIGPNAPDVTISIPAADWLIEQSCPDPPDEANAYGVLVGYVRDAEGRPVRTAPVSVSFSTFVGSLTALAERRRVVETETDDAGRYVACPVPIDLPIRVTADIGGRSVEVTTRLNGRFGAADVGPASSIGRPPTPWWSPRSVRE